MFYSDYGRDPVMTVTAEDFLKVPPASVAAAVGCIRVTILNRKGDGLSAIFRLEDIPTYMQGVGDALDLENDDPTEVMNQIARVVKRRRVDDDDTALLALLALWVAKQFDKGMSNAIDVVAEATGRVALLAREKKGQTDLRASWQFLVGAEKGVNEAKPLGNPVPAANSGTTT